MFRFLPAAFLVACSGSGIDEPGAAGPSSTVNPSLYDFESHFEPGVSSVAHSGQTARQVLILDLKAHLGGITDRIDTGVLFPAAGDVNEELEFYFAFDGTTSGDIPLLLTTEPSSLQQTHGAISSSANLVGKIAGNDEVGQHRDWSVDLMGWDHPAVDTPESLVRHWFAEIDQAAVDRANAVVPVGPYGQPVPSVFLSADGVDRQQLLEKFLHGAVSFSQATDDYLDDDLDGKGLYANHELPDDGGPYTALEHAWDEGFGYFGASRVYGQLSDEQVSEERAHDAFEVDGVIDLGTEYCFGASVNAAKRDMGAVAPTNFTAQAWDGFHRGRAMLALTQGPLTTDQMRELRGHRDAAVEGWEMALAATAIHYVNDTLQDMERFDTADYDFASHAKHWSELKGFAMAFQFNPRSPMSDEEFVELHALIGQAPVLPNAGAAAIDAYRADLLTARELIAQVYDFDAANLGDDSGNGGW